MVVYPHLLPSYNSPYRPHICHFASVCVESGCHCRDKRIPTIHHQTHSESDSASCVQQAPLGLCMLIYVNYHHFLSFRVFTRGEFLHKRILMSASLNIEY